MAGSSSKKIIIVGGGVIGLCTAYYASMRGHQVTVIDRSQPDHLGCSFGNAGMLVPSHFVPLAAPGMVALGLKWMWNPESPFYIKPRLDWDLISWGLKFWQAANRSHVDLCAPLLRDLHLASRAEFEVLSQLANDDFGLLKRGLLMLCKSQHALDDEARYAQQAQLLGIPAQVLSPEETARLDPQVRMDIAGAVFFPKDCSLTPHVFMQGLRRRAEAQGTRFFWGSEVKGWRIDQQRIDAIQTSTGDHSGDAYVLAGGSWSPTIARDLNLRLPMQAGKGYSVTLTNPRQLPAICSIFTEARVAVTPMGSSLRFGGTMEMSGLNEDINPIRVQGIIKSIPHYYPEFQLSDFDDLKPWSGLRPCSPDGLPYMGRLTAYSNLWTATGHAMMGLSLGPITGKLMAQLLSDEPAQIPIDRLDPNRYA